MILKNENIKFFDKILIIKKMCKNRMYRYFQRNLGGFRIFDRHNTCMIMRAQFYAANTV